MLYDIAFLIFSIFYLPTLLFKGKLHGDFLERFGIYNKIKNATISSGKGTIWIQAVSVGEVSLCRSLIPSLKQYFPDRKIVLSTITKTGNDLAKKLFSDHAAVIYFPLDFSFIVKKVFSIINPGIYVMIETEIWPNILKEAAKRGVRSILINGRISDKSFEKYKFAKPFLKKTLGGIDRFCMQSKLDADRIVELGAPAGNVSVTGNMKFDADINVNAKGRPDLRKLLGLEPGAELFVAGSTHGDEEEIVLSVFRRLVEEFKHLQLLIAPRHITRAGEIEELAGRLGFEPVRVSSLGRDHSPRTADEKRKVLILDTIGQLRDIYAIASIVFVGGSLVKHGGQNPIEPAAFEKPVIFGPYMFNFKDIAGAFLDAKAALQVSDEEELFRSLRLLLNDKEMRARLGSKAKSAVFQNRGATQKNLEVIKGV